MGTGLAEQSFRVQDLSLNRDGCFSYHLTFRF